ncbi:hypothetical protein HNQ59_002171 [Chitinivorax tropicus]|uniref:Uncharacterized protein n=1 Tax=Chitinivorax tropicus TaxID=714531 RepID=A0A840MI41_9PROT|nr:hypothetical protein [Chitinivorax tropicus]MBB5018874.1 hypothetical protein [Chitinivorax tropicus]
MMYLDNWASRGNGFVGFAAYKGDYGYDTGISKKWIDGEFDN